MLGKLLKHEFHAVSRLLLPMHLALILVTLVGRFYVQFAVSNMDSRFDLMNVSLVMFYMLALFAILVLTYVYLYILRPHKNLFSDEGYLMHTLPVTASMHIWSKLIVSVCWILLDLFLISLSVFCMLVNAEFLEYWPQMIKEIQEMITFTTGMNFILGAITFILDLLVSCARGILVVYMCMAIGHSFNQYKLLISVAIYIGVYVASSIVNTLFSILIGVPWLRGGGFSSLFIVGTYPDSYRVNTQILTWFDILFSLGIAVAAFFVTRYFLTKRLNLE